MRPGEPVQAQQVLVVLEDQDLVLERQKWSAEIAQLDKQYREALSKDDAAQIVIARSKLEQAQTQLDLASRQLERASLRAPIDGVLISGDLSQSIGMPVKRGQELMTVAPDEALPRRRRGRRAGHRLAANGPACAGACSRRWPSSRSPSRVTRIAPVATPLDGRNVFEVEGRLDASAPLAASRAARRGARSTSTSAASHRSGGSAPATGCAARRGGCWDERRWAAPEALAPPRGDRREAP